MTHWKRHWSKSTAQRPAHIPSVPAQEKQKMDDYRNDQTSPINDGRSVIRAPNKPEHTFLTTGEAAHFLRLSARTLERFRVEGTGPRFTKAGPGVRARVLYRREDLEDWLKSFEYESTSQYGRER